MRLVVISHKVVWPCPGSPSGYATDGGFPMQMRALSELFDATTLVVPCDPRAPRTGEVVLDGHRLSVAPLTLPAGRGAARKLALLPWLARNAPRLAREVARADAVHAPIPGDVGTFGIFAALAGRKPLFVRHCGNWFVQQTAAERFWRWLLERVAGGRTVVLTTGDADAPPSARNPNVRWVFSSSLTEAELRACAPNANAGRPHGPRLVIACRQERAKGTGAVIESLPVLARRFPGVHLDVVGDGAALPEFEALAARVGVAERVTFHGRLNHAGVVAALRRSDVFCFPTTSSEGFPKAVLEALACGLPVVTTRVSVLGRLVGAGGGVLLDAATSAEVVRGVLACVEDRARYRAMSEAGVHTAREYSLERWRDTIGAHLVAGWGGPLQSRA